jgi:hypothetical protein
MSEHFRKSLCYETSICDLSGVLAGETSARAPDGRAENYHSHTMLFSKKIKGLADDIECVAHIWLTASEEYVVFIPPSED